MIGLSLSAETRLLWGEEKQTVMVWLRTLPHPFLRADSGLFLTVAAQSEDAEPTPMQWLFHSVLFPLLHQSSEMRRVTW